MTRACRTGRAPLVARFPTVADKRIRQAGDAQVECAGMAPSRVRRLRTSAITATRVVGPPRVPRDTSANASRHNRVRQLLATPLLALTLIACTGNPTAPDPATARPPQWHCDDDGSNGWNCVESTAISADTARTRVRSARPAASAAATASGVTAAAPDSEATASRQTAAAATEPLPETTDTTANSAESAAVSVAVAPAEAAPAAASLPDEPRMRRIGDLPPDYWAIQIIAVANREQLEAFAAEYDLFRHPAARIESKGSVRYILLWDFYATRAEAAAAMETLPPAIKALQPWPRSVESLQQALRRAASLEPRPAASDGG